MKELQFKKLIGTLAVFALIAFAPAYASQRGDLADTDMERALVTSGFKVRPANNSEQRKQLRRLPDNEFTMMKEGGNTYYLYPDKKDNRLYAGDHWAYRAYQGYLKNKHLRAQGVFVWEVNPSDKANNKTIEVWHGYPPFREW
jgi:hypothetical protein